MAGKWMPIRLGSVCTKIGSGATPRGGGEVYLDAGPYALIRSQNVYNDGFHREGLAYIGEKHAAELANVEVLEGDVLLNITGDSVARACQVDPCVLPARVNQHVAIIRPDPDMLDPRFLRYFLVSPGMQSKLLSWAGSGGTRNALTKGMIESFDVPAPEDIKEQRAIAHILGTLDDKIVLNRRISETLVALARTLFKSWFVDFDPVRAKVEGRNLGLPDAITALFPDAVVEDPDLGEIPQGWEAGTLSAFADLNTESWSQSTAPDTVRYIDLANTKWGSITSIVDYSWEEAPSRARRILRPWDTIIGTVRPGNGSYALIMEQGLTGSTGFAVLRPRKPRYRSLVHIAATSRDNIDRLNHLADGAAYPAVRPDVVAATRVVKAPEPVLDLFARVVDPLLSKFAAAERESRTLAALRDALLPKLISGDLRLDDPSRILGRAG